MLMANETVAEDYYWQEIPFLYRIHEKPDEEKMAKPRRSSALRIYIADAGRRSPSKELQKLLER